MNEVNITELFNYGFRPSDYSTSQAEAGFNAGPFSWRAAMDRVEEPPFPLIDDTNIDQFKKYLATFGAWSDEEIGSWIDEEVNALFLQLVAGDVRDAFPDGVMGDKAWKKYAAAASVGKVNSNLFRSDNGDIFYSISV